MKKSSAPNVLWWIAIIIAAIGVLMFYEVFQIESISCFWVEVIALGIMAIAAKVK